MTGARVRHNSYTHGSGDGDPRLRWQTTAADTRAMIARGAHHESEIFLSAEARAQFRHHAMGDDLGGGEHEAGGSPATLTDADQPTRALHVLDGAPYSPTGETSGRLHRREMIADDGLHLSERLTEGREILLHHRRQ